MRGKWKIEGKRVKKTARTIVTAASVAPFALMAPIATVAVAVPSEEVTVKQPLGEVWMNAVESELGGSFQVGDSITLDLDDIFEGNLGELNLTYINTNSNVAEVTLLSGDLHIGGMNAGSTIVELIARKRESQVPAVHERFVLHVANNNRIVDANQDGITIDDIVRYMRVNPGKLFRSEELGYLLNQIKPVEAAVNQPPITDWETYDIYVKKGQSYTIDVKSFFFDEDGDSLTYSASASSGAYVSASITSGSLLTVLTEASVGTELTVWVEANDGHSEYAAWKEINVIVENTPPVVQSTTVDTTIPEDESFDVEDFISASDEDGDTLYYDVSEIPSYGYVYLDDVTNKLKYSPILNFNGTDSFKIVVYDDNGGTAEVQFSVTVTPVNDAPSGFNISNQTTLQDQSFYLELPSDMFIDPEGDPFTYELVRTEFNNSGDNMPPEWWVFNADTGVISGIPSSVDVGVHTFLIAATDQYGASNFIVFQIDVQN